MKKIFVLAAAFLCAYQISNAQTQKGNQTLGFTFNYYHSSNNSSTINGPSGVFTQATKYTSYNIGPSYGYFIADKSELGIGLNYLNTKQNDANTSTSGNQSDSQTNNGYGVNVFFRKYVLYQNKIGFRVGPYAGYNRNKITYNTLPVYVYNDGSSIQNGFSAGGNFDLVYYPSNKVGLTASLASLNYSHTKTTGDINQGSGESFGLHFINSGWALTAFLVF